MDEFPRVLDEDLISWARDVYKVDHEDSNVPDITIDTKPPLSCKNLTLKNSRIPKEQKIAYEDIFSNNTNEEKYMTFERPVESENSICIKWKRPLCFQNKIIKELDDALKLDNFTSMTIGDANQENYVVKSMLPVKVSNLLVKPKCRTRLQILFEEQTFISPFRVELEPNGGKTEKNVKASVVGGSAIPGNGKVIFKHLATLTHPVPGYTKNGTFIATGTIEMKKVVRHWTKVVNE